MYSGALEDRTVAEILEWHQTHGSCGKQPWYAALLLSTVQYCCTVLVSTVRSLKTDRPSWWVSSPPAHDSFLQW
jgi:hypothetical protein